MANPPKSAPPVSNSDWGPTLESTTKVFEPTHINLTVNLENPDGSTSFDQNERRKAGQSIAPAAAAAAPLVPSPPASTPATESLVETTSSSAAIAPGSGGGTLELSIDTSSDFQIETRVTPDRQSEEPVVEAASLQMDTAPPIRPEPTSEIIAAEDTGSLLGSLPTETPVSPPEPTELPFSLSPDSGAGQNSEVQMPVDSPVIQETGTFQETPAMQEAPVAREQDLQVDEVMPYLNRSDLGKGAAAALAFAQPSGDAIIPGGAVNHPDEETLKSYLLLREQDVAALSGQLKSAMDQIRSLEDRLRIESAKVVELSHVVEEQDHQIKNFDLEKQKIAESYNAEMSELRFQAKTKTDKAKLLEAQVLAATQEVENIKDRVRQDIRKIRIREKELENKLEILKKDSESLLSTREGKIIELKRKVDLLEFNMDLLQDQLTREKDKTNELRERLLKAAQVVRVVGGLLDSKEVQAQAADLEKKAS